MIKRLPLATIFLIVFTISGCSLTPARNASVDIFISNEKKAALADSRTVREKVYQQYQQWKGTKYRRGGLSKKGIDCSGLIYVTYLEKFGIALPRSTGLLSQVGKEVKRGDLRPGDLVFFKTGLKARHVGIYIENGKFLHVSTRKGVTISKLTDYYWKDRYRSSRRVGL